MSIDRYQDVSDCDTCKGTGQTPEHAGDGADPAEIARRVQTGVTRCDRCTDGIDAPWVDRFSREYVARWPIDQPWRVAGGEIRAWLADLNSRPQL